MCTFNAVNIPPDHSGHESFLKAFTVDVIKSCFQINFVIHFVSQRED